MSRFLRPEALFFLALWLVLLVLFRERGFYDPGSLWHPVVGQLILDRGFPWTDPFTFTFEGKTWIPQQWGAEVAMALAHRVGGLDTLLLGFATLVAGLWAWVFARMRVNGMNWALAGALTAAAMFAGGFHYFVRPHMATIALLGWTMGCVIDYDRGRVSVWRLAGLIPLYIVWTNLHGGVLGGVMTLGLAVGWWCLKPTPDNGWASRPRLLLVGIVAACGLTPFVNPFGLEMLRTWERIVFSKVMPEVVNEHKPLDIMAIEGQIIVGFGVLYLFLLAGALPRVRFAWLIPLVWFALTFKGIRNGPLFAITGAVALADFWPHTRWHRLLLTHGDSLVYAFDNPAAVPARLGWKAWLLPAMAVAVALGLQAGGVPVPVVGRGWAQLNPKMIPVDIADAVRAYQREAGPGARIFNDVNLGGFLIYHAPGLKIYGDDRFELSGDDWLLDYQDFLYEHPERIEAMADQYGFDHALTVTGKDCPEKLDGYLKTARHPSGRPRWREVARGERAVLFAREKE